MLQKGQTLLSGFFPRLSTSRAPQKNSKTSSASLNGSTSTGQIPRKSLKHGHQLSSSSRGPTALKSMEPTSTTSCRSDFEVRRPSVPRKSCERDFRGSHHVCHPRPNSARLEPSNGGGNGETSQNQYSPAVRQLPLDRASFNGSSHGRMAQRCPPYHQGYRRSPQKQDPSYNRDQYRHHQEKGTSRERSPHHENGGRTVAYNELYKSKRFEPPPHVKARLFSNGRSANNNNNSRNK